MPSAKQILLPQPIEPEALAILENAGCEILHAPDTDPRTILPLLGQAHGVVLRTGITVSRELLCCSHELQVIARTGGGVDNVDVQAATERGIIVTSNVGVNTASVVEHCLSLMLALFKQLPLMDRSVRTDRFSIRYQNLPRDLRGKTLGLIGFGRIGSDLAWTCHQMFRMKIIAYDPFLPEEIRNNCCEWAQFVDSRTLFSTADVISIHVPLTDKTRHAVGKAELAWMKPDAILINTARGPVVDESALTAALQEKRIGGAGLDVLADEPPSSENPLLKLDNVILTPHTAALTHDCVIRMAVDAAKCALDVFAGREPPNVANRDVLKDRRWMHLIPR